MPRHQCTLTLVLLVGACLPLRSVRVQGLELGGWQALFHADGSDSHLATVCLSSSSGDHAILPDQT